MNRSNAITQFQPSFLRLACVALLALSGCKKDDASNTISQGESEPAAADPAAQKQAPTKSKAIMAAQIAVEISKAPEQADAILAKQGMSRADLESLMFEIAKDPQLRKAYNAARRESLATR